jgi:K319-like protein
MSKKNVLLFVAAMLMCIVMYGQAAAASFSEIAVADIEVGNDPQAGPDLVYNPGGSGLGARNVPDRRRVVFIQYDISGIKVAGEVFKNVSLSNFGHDQDDPIDVYGVIESQDDLPPGDDVEDLSWNTAPGVMNAPTPPLNSPVVLDLADVVGPLMTFTPPAQGDRESTPISQELADFLNDDTDGTVIIMYAITIDGNQAIVRSSEHDAGGNGTWLEGETGPANAAFDPIPGNHTTVSLDLTELCWSNPDPNFPDGEITCDVYFGRADLYEPNELEPGYGLLKIATGTDQTCMAVPETLEQFKTYCWVVDCWDSSAPADEQFLPGVLWDFNTNNEAPTVNAGDDQYIWLNNAGDPATATAEIDATVNDDGLPTGQINYLWTQLSGPVNILIDPNNIEDITLLLPEVGTYSFRLTVDDTDLDGFDVIQIIVAADPCLAAQAMPGYTLFLGDLDQNCIVDLRDLGIMAADWLACNSLECP